MKATRQIIIQSETDANKTYTVTKRDDGSYHCTCKSFAWRTEMCKHIKKVMNEGLLQLKPSWLNSNWLQWHVKGKTGFTKQYCGLTDCPDVTIADGRYVVSTHTMVKLDSNGNVKEIDKNVVDSLGYWYFFGGWWDETNGEYLVEICRIYKSNIHLAMTDAIKYKQCYIYDLAVGRDLSVQSYKKLKSLKYDKEKLVKHIECIYLGFVESGYDYSTFERAWNESVADLKALNRRISLLEKQGGFK